MVFKKRFLSLLCLCLAALLMLSACGGSETPEATDANGEVIFKFKESNYHVTLSNLPAGLVAEAEYHFTTDTLRIVLKKA